MLALIASAEEHARPALLGPGDGLAHEPRLADARLADDGDDLTSRLGDQVIVRVQNPVTFPKHDSELQPDILLLRPRADFYTGSHPLAEDVLLLIEVADTTLRLDRRVKIPLYARVEVSETWLCDLVAGAVEIYREPVEGAYRAIHTLARGQTLSPVALPDVRVRVEDLIG
ncbi:MAG TPA: Uma2 family endonuclease [Methylomirabilota bacterium]|nr:Uma2 family endonuclease [Methylomirabilota bacterium]